jgi:selenium-dependent xanthine dehydrogenase
MGKFNLNGSTMTVAEDINLLEYLREEVRLTSVKSGCAEGACGTCMVLVDGKAVRACLLTTHKVNGKNVITVEGLSEREKDLFAWAFAEAGAVQCGFCIPGMVISAKALLDANLSPSDAEIKAALRGNICRCTGYVKIEQAVRLAAKALRDEVQPVSTQCRGVGQRLRRIDARAKVLGTGEYVDDLQVAGMLYAAVLRSKYPRAVIRSLDVSAAKACSGVEAVLTAYDIPGQRYWGFLAKDWPALVAVGEETHYVGDAIVLVAAVSKRIARAALGLIKVEYEELPPITSPREALQEAAPQLHATGNILSTTRLQRGSVDEALAKAQYMVTRTYHTPPTEHGFLEPESALAVPQEDGRITVYVGTQSVYEDQHGIAALLGVPCEKIRVVGKLVGGAFGGKEDLSVQHHAALLALYTNKPVKLTLARQESILVHPKRHAMEIEVTTACDAAGYLTAIRARIISDTGAYASLGGPVLQRACTHLAGPYHVPHVDIIGTAVYTNNPPGGAFRGFGVPQSVFASETNLDLLAEQVGITAWEIRFRNALEPGMEMASGQIADASTAIKETLLAVKETYEFHRFTGIACAMKNTGIGVGVPDKAQVKIRIQQGRVLVLTSAACIGQGLGTVLTQIVGETTGLPDEAIIIHAPDTDVTPDAGTTTASRQTMFTGEAARQAALQLVEDLRHQALSALEGREYSGEYLGVTDPLNSSKTHPVNHVAYGYATQVVVLDESGKVSKVVAAHDVGRAINPTAIEGQIEGAIAMGLGYALREDFPLINGVPSVKFGTLGLFRTTDMPEIETIIIEKNASLLAYGAKGVGEIATIPTAPAVASAYYKYDGVYRDRLPLEKTAYRP